MLCNYKRPHWRSEHSDIRVSPQFSPHLKKTFPLLHNMSQLYKEFFFCKYSNYYKRTILSLSYQLQTLANKLPDGLRVFCVFSPDILPNLDIIYINSVLYRFCLLYSVATWLAEIPAALDPSNKNDLDRLVGRFVDLLRLVRGALWRQATEWRRCRGVRTISAKFRQSDSVSLPNLICLKLNIESAYLSLINVSILVL